VPRQVATSMTEPDSIFPTNNFCPSGKSITNKESDEGSGKEVTVGTLFLFTSLPKALSYDSIEGHNNNREKLGNFSKIEHGLLPYAISKPTVPSKSRVTIPPRSIFDRGEPAEVSLAHWVFCSRVKELFKLVLGEEVTDEADSVRAREQVITSPKS
jgi:hypothetical protein